ncbi:ABC transporter ATP-binding protein [Fusibacter sp. JL298sf-3]
MLEVNGINKRFGRHQVLSDVTFCVDKGEIVGFIGPNGSGKSTTMKCITRLVFPDSGEVIIGGQSLKKRPKEALSKLGALIESPGLYPNLTGMEHLKLFGKLREVSPKELNGIVSSIGMTAHIHKVTYKYSMGMKQRMGLGIALLSQPEYLILDEPFSGLDPQGIFELRKTLMAIAESGVSLLISSHQLLELEKVSTRSIFIKNGEIVDRQTLESETLTKAYKIRFLDGQHLSDQTIEELKDLNLITKCELTQEGVLVWVTRDQALSAVLGLLVQNKYWVRSVVPVEKDLERLYKELF